MSTPVEPMVMLPCPFCGESARLAVHRKKSGRKDGYQAKCLSCFVGQTRTYYSDREQSVVAWNRRDGSLCRNGCMIDRAVEEFCENTTSDY